jgi:hypothetical protein
LRGEDADAARCEDCGRRIAGVRRVPGRGYGYLYYLLSPTMLHPGQQIGGTTFNGTADQARTILMLFATIAAFGAASMFYGLWMLFTGRRSVAIMLVVLAFAVALAGMCWWTLQVLPE